MGAASVRWAPYPLHPHVRLYVCINLQDSLRVGYSISNINNSYNRNINTKSHTYTCIRRSYMWGCVCAHLLSFSLARSLFLFIVVVKVHCVLYQFTTFMRHILAYPFILLLRPHGETPAAKTCYRVEKSVALNGWISRRRNYSLVMCWRVSDR